MKHAAHQIQQVWAVLTRHWWQLECISTIEAGISSIGIMSGIRGVVDKRRVTVEAVVKWLQGLLQAWEGEG